MTGIQQKVRNWIPAPRALPSVAFAGMTFKQQTTNIFRFTGITMNLKTFIICAILIASSTFGFSQTENLVELSNDSGIADTAIVLGKQYTSLAVRFTPPATEEHVSLISIRYFVPDTIPGQVARLTIMTNTPGADCNGDPLSNSPGSELFIPIDITATIQGWNEVDVASFGLTFTSDFYASLRTAINTKLMLGIDQTDPRLQRTYYDDG